MQNQPRYRHYHDQADSMMFLGEFGRYDLWWHDQRRQVCSTIVARYGHDWQETLTGRFGHEALERGLDLAIERGLIDPLPTDSHDWLSAPVEIKPVKKTTTRLYDDTVVTPIRASKARERRNNDDLYAQAVNKLMEDDE